MNVLPDLSQLDGVGTVGFAVLVVLAFFLGWIVPKRVMDDAIRQRDRALDLLAQAQEDNEVTHDLLRAIKASAERPGGAP